MLLERSRGVTPRIFAATNDARLIAIDAESGKVCEDFGTKGKINLNESPGEQAWVGEYQVTSPPVVIAAGGHGTAGTKLGGSIVAYTLPD